MESKLEEMFGFFEEQLKKERGFAENEIEWIKKVIQFYKKRKQYLEKILNVKKETLLEELKKRFN